MSNEIIFRVSQRKTIGWSDLTLKEMKETKRRRIEEDKIENKKKRIKGEEEDEKKRR